MQPITVTAIALQSLVNSCWLKTVIVVTHSQRMPEVETYLTRLFLKAARTSRQARMERPNTRPEMTGKTTETRRSMKKVMKVQRVKMVVMMTTMTMWVTSQGRRNSLLASLTPMKRRMEAAR